MDRSAKSRMVRGARVLAWAFAAAAVLLSDSIVHDARAHTAGTIGFATVIVDGSQVRYELALGLQSVPEPIATALRLRGPDPDLLALQAQVARYVQVGESGAVCMPSASPTPLARPDSILIALRFECPVAMETLALRDDLADLFGTDYHTLANIAWQDGNAQFMFQPDRREARIALARSGPQGLWSFTRLGIQHILVGFDHLLFLLALVLRGGNAWSLLKIVTAFTIAHSITLGLAAFDLIVLPARLVEGAIALSIAYVAAENLFAKQPTSHRWAVSFAFGLVHGIGFSSVLRDLGLPQDGLIWALLGFNLGVEAGQAVAVLAALPLLLYLKRTRFEARTVMAVSVLVLVVGLALFVERAVLGVA